MEIGVPDGFDPGAAPAGITIRLRVEADDRAIVAVIEEAFRDPWSYEEAVQEWAGSENYDPTLWLVAPDGEEMVEPCSDTCRMGEGRSALGARDAWRRRGIARTLLRASFAMFRDRGVDDARLNVDRDNASDATHLYEQAGMRLRRRWLMVARTMITAQDGSSQE